MPEASLIVPISVEPLDEAVDLWIDENHQRVVQLTEYPIEDGSTIASHAAVMPDNISLRGIISNVPRGGVRRVPKAWDLMLEVSAKREPIQVATRGRTYPSALIVELNSTTPGYGMSFNMVVRELVTPGGERGGLVPSPSSPAGRRTTTASRGRIGTSLSPVGTAARLGGA